MRELRLRQKRQITKRFRHDANAIFHIQLVNCIEGLLVGTKTAFAL
jgi:hypothetical protein